MGERITELVRHRYPSLGYRFRARYRRAFCNSYQRVRHHVTTTGAYMKFSKRAISTIRDCDFPVSSYQYIIHFT
jgi:hypothetical protein